MSKMPPFPINWVHFVCATGLSIAGQSASAACVGSPGTTTCSNTSPAIVLNNTTNPAVQASVVLDSTFQVDATAGAALNIDNTSSALDVSLQQAAGGHATSVYGFMVQSNGSIAQTLNGNVTGTGQSGVATTIRPTGSYVSINQVAGEIAGVMAGITTWNQGTGSTTITTAGKVTSATRPALSILNAQPAPNQTLPAGTTLTINQTGGVISGATGISAGNYGSGATTITTNGPVTGTAGSGVTITSAKQLAITQSASSPITATGAGISGTNLGGGDTTITTNAAIKSSANVGITAEQRVAGNLIIKQSAGDIEGSTAGISATNFGTGALEISVSANVKAAGSAGLGVYASGGTAAPANVGKVTVTQAPGTVISGGDWGLALNQFGAQPIEFSTSGTIVGGAGGGMYTASARPPGSPVIIDMLSGADISSSSGLAIRDGGGQAQLTLHGGSKVTGHIRLGSNSDTMLVKAGAVISPDTEIDGGSTAAATDLLGSTSWTNKLTFQGGTLTRAGATILNWQTITLDGTPTELTDSLLNTGTGTNPDGSLQGLLLRNAAKVTLQPVVQISGDVSIDPGTTLNHSAGGAIKGAVTNNGTMYWVHASAPSYSNLSNSSYASSANGALVMNTLLGVDSSPSDVLTIDGGTGTGASTLRITNTTGPGALTTGNGILVVDAINGATTVPGAFVLANRLFAGAFEYKLYRGSIDASNPNAWYLRSEATPGPVAQDDSFTTPPGVTLNGNVTPNDSYTPGSIFSATGPLSNPSAGTLGALDSASGSFVFTPAAGFVGTVTFPYQVCLPAPSATVCDDAVVTITVAVATPAVVPVNSPVALAALGGGVMALMLGMVRRRNRKHQK